MVSPRFNAPAGIRCRHSVCGMVCQRRSRNRSEAWRMVSIAGVMSALRNIDASVEREVENA